jgi:hypothetical protein
MLEHLLVSGGRKLQLDLGTERLRKRTLDLFPVRDLGRAEGTTAVSLSRESWAPNW